MKNNTAIPAISALPGYAWLRLFVGDHAAGIWSVIGDDITQALETRGPDLEPSALAGILGQALATHLGAEG